MAFMDGNTPVGFCQLKEEPKAMKVARLYIDQSYSGKGAGKALMEHVMIKTQVLGKRSMWFEVFESNKPAMGLYNKLGFKKVDYYRISLINEEIVDVMSKELYIYMIM
jgi:ribosomal protein S18 acetylase RimI-like enzyme